MLIDVDVDNEVDVEALVDVDADFDALIEEESALSNDNESDLDQKRNQKNSLMLRLNLKDLQKLTQIELQKLNLQLTCLQRRIGSQKLMNLR